MDLQAIYAFVFNCTDIKGAFDWQHSRNKSLVRNLLYRDFWAT